MIVGPRLTGSPVATTWGVKRLEVKNRGGEPLGVAGGPRGSFLAQQVLTVVGGGYCSKLMYLVVVIV